MGSGCGFLRGASSPPITVSKSPVMPAASRCGRTKHEALSTCADANAIAQVQQSVRRRLLRVFVRRGLLPADAAQAMAQWEHGGGFSVDGSVRIEAADRADREWLLRYCAQPPFALDRLRALDPERLLYDGAKPGPGGSGPLRIIAFITATAVVRNILISFGQPIAPPTVAPARGRTAMGGAGRCRQRRVPRGHSRPARSGLRLRTAHRLVVRHPRTPPWRGAGAACAGHGQRPQACSPARHCRAIDPEICITTASPLGHAGSFAAALTSITKTEILGFLG